MSKRKVFDPSRRFATPEAVFEYLEGRFGKGAVRRLENEENLLGQKIFYEFEVDAEKIYGWVTFAEGSGPDRSESNLDLFSYRHWNKLYWKE